MSVTRIATRYAKSLIDLATEQGKLEQVFADIHTINEAAKHRELHLMLKSPIIKGDKKKAVLLALFGGKIETLTQGYLGLLIDKNREIYLPEIAAEFVSQYKNLKKITTVKVISATPLSENVLADLKHKIANSGITHANVEIETALDASLVGGYVLEFDNKRYDASVTSKLAELKQSFSKNLYVKEF